jgi:2-oxoglutarate ferredoxin oxidoreductase subunit alpha
MDYSIKIGGEAGQGIQTIGHVLAKVLTRGGSHVFVNQDYESRIRGGHNIYQLRFSHRNIFSPSKKIDIIVAFDKASIEEHGDELTENGMVLYDSETLGKKYNNPLFLDVPMQSLAVEKGGNRVMMNTAAAGAVLGMLGYDFSILEAIIKSSFSKKGTEIIEGNIKAGKSGHEYAKEKCHKCDFKILPVKGNKMMLMNGNEALALGALAAGCKFASAYPMTPSTGVITYLAGKAEDYDLVIEQAEDEIAAINMAIGASYAGVRALTATSGGGFCLMTEGISLAGMTETPLVIVLAQRPGPATGLPTRTEQGELLFALNAGHGEFPRVIMAPGTAEEAFYSIQKAFNIAEKYQTIVIVMSDQHLADSYWSIESLDPSRIKVDRAMINDDEITDDYKRHKITDSGVSPRAIPGQAGKAVVVTDSDEHDEDGHIIEDSSTRNTMVKKRMRKLQGISSEILKPGLYGKTDPELLLIGWGSTYGAIKEAVDTLNSQGKHISMLHFMELWPFPEGIAETVRSAKKSFTVENNSTGQLRRLIRMETGVECSGSITKYDGRPLTPEDIIKEVENANN